MNKISKPVYSINNWCIIGNRLSGISNRYMGESMRNHVLTSRIIGRNGNYSIETKNSTYILLECGDITSIEMLNNIIDLENKIV